MMFNRCFLSSVLLLVLAALVLATGSVEAGLMFESEDDFVNWLRASSSNKASAVIPDWVDKWPNVTREDLSEAISIIAPYGYGQDFARCSVEGIIKVQPNDQRPWHWRDNNGNIVQGVLSDIFYPDVELEVFKYGDAFVAKACGNFSAPSPTIPGTLVIRKFDDSNMNGAWDSGEDEISGWPVSYSGPESGSGVTPLSVEVAPGTYTVREQVLGGWDNTTPSSVRKTVESCDTSTAVFGNIELSSIAGIKWDDTNCNGLLDGEEQVLPGWTITIAGKDIAGNDVNRDPIVTGPDGSYKFDNLYPSDAAKYTIAEILSEPKFWGPTKPLDPALQQVPYTLSPEPYLIKLEEGVDLTGIDFGNVQLGTITGLKFYDANSALPPEDPRNGNGSYDEGEPFLADWTFTLTGTCDLGLPIVTRTQLTDEYGVFQFDQLYPTHVEEGYTICEDLPPDWILTYPQELCRTTLLDEAEEIVTGFEYGNIQIIDYGARTIGYWKTHPNAITREMYENLSDLPAFAGINTWKKLNPILAGANAVDMAVMLRAQLAGTELNVLAGIVPRTAWIYIGDIPGAPALFGGNIVTLDHILNTIESAYPWTLWDRATKETAKNALDNVNNNANIVSPSPL